MEDVNGVNVVFSSKEVNIDSESNVQFPSDTRDTTTVVGPPFVPSKWWILRILSARYGPCEVADHVDKLTLVRDVTSHIKALLQVDRQVILRNDALMIPTVSLQGLRRVQIPVLRTHRLSMNAIFGDPAPGLSKRLTIRYSLAAEDSTNHPSIPLEVSFPEHEACVVLKTRVIAPNKVLQDLLNTGAATKPSSWRLPDMAAEIVLPMVLEFLVIRDRVKSQRVCRQWKRIIQTWGIATTIDTGAFPHFTIPLLQGLLTHSPMLENLCLSDHDILQSQHLCSLLPHLKKLRSLDISRCVQLDDSTLEHVAAHNCTTLQVLYIKGLPLVTDRGIKAICRSCFNMKTLDISYLHQVTDEGAVAIGRHLTQLQALFMRDNYQVTNDSIDIITTHCKNLEQLTLWGCYQINRLLLTGPANTKLVMLNLWGCFGVGEDAAHALSQMESLRSLILSECHRLTDSFVQTMVCGVPKLKHLQLRYCRNLTDASVQAIEQRLEHLYSLDLSFCTNISGKAIASLIERRGRYQLAEIRLVACRKLDIVSDDEAQPIALADMGDSGRRILEAMRCLTPPLSLSVLDLRSCGGHVHSNKPYREPNPFVRGLHQAGFVQHVPGFFTRNIRWDLSTEQKIVDELRGILQVS